jgi:hypothetical protein
MWLGAKYTETLVQFKDRFWGIDARRHVIERRRRGGLRGTATTALRLRAQDIGDELDAGPQRHPASAGRQYGYFAKEFNDLLNPLERFLRKQVGRPWRKVEQDVRAAVDTRTIAGRHLLDHVCGRFGFVTVRTVEIDGRICDADSPSMDSRLREVAGFYVHPRSGLLRYKR